MNDDVWVVVPTYNEAPVVGEVLTGLLKWFPNIVCVGDGSADGSSAKALEAGVRVVRHAINLGAGAALQTGVEFALFEPSARYFVSFDADGQHRPEDAAAMIDRLRCGPEQILIGSRFLGNAEGMATRRRMLLKSARVFERFATDVKLTDAHNGLRAFTREFATKINLALADMAHASELLELIHDSGLPFAEHPVTINYTDYSRAKGQRSINAVNIAVDVWVHHLLRGRRS